VAKLKRQELALLRSRIGYVFQNGALFDSMDVARISASASPTKISTATRSSARRA